MNNNWKKLLISQIYENKNEILEYFLYEDKFFNNIL